MINDRDRKVIEFVKEFGVVRTSTILELFFNEVSNVVGYRRLKRLCEYKELKRERFYVNDEYIYYIPGAKPKQLRHKLLLTEFYKLMNENYDILKFENEITTFKSLRPDGFIAFKTSQNKGYIGFIEVEISNNRFNLQKYIDLYKSNTWVKHYPIFPVIFAISNKIIKNNSVLNLIQVKEDFSNFKAVMGRL